jgi:hypothetical protein
MHTTRITLADRRRYADQTTVRWRVMVGTGLVGLAASFVVWVWGDQRTRADEMIVLITTVLCLGLSPIFEWVLRFAFARVSTLSDRLTAADMEIERLAGETTRLNNVLHIEDLAAETAEFERVAESFWARLEQAFSQYLVAGVPYHIHTLREMIDAAAWPDRLAPKRVDGIEAPVGVDEVTAEFAACVYPQFGFELVPKESFASFDVLRRNVRRRIRQWGDRLGSDQSNEVRDWLRTELGPVHAHTIKMAWYLDIAYAERTAQKSQADEGYYRAVRDAVEAGFRRAIDAGPGKTLGSQGAPQWAPGVK